MTDYKRLSRRITFVNRVLAEYLQERPPGRLQTAIMADWVVTALADPMAWFPGDALAEAVARDAGWQPAPTVGPDVDNIARTISQAVGGYNKDATTIRNAARAVADADPRRTEAEVKAEALEEAADNVRRSDWYTSWKVDNYAGTIQHWLRDRAARLREGQ